MQSWTKAICQNRYTDLGKFNMVRYKAIRKEKAGKENKASCAELEEQEHEKIIE